MEKKYCHIEPFHFLEIGKDGILFVKEGQGTGESRWILFDYEKRNLLTNEAALLEIRPEDMAEAL